MAIATYTSSTLNRAIQRHSDASAADTLLALTTPTGRAVKLIFVAVKYSAAPTQAGVTVELDSGISAAYDTVLLTGSANAQSTVLIPTRDVIIADTDAIRVTAPAGGAVITSQISIYTEAIE